MRQIVRDLNEQRVPWTSGSRSTPEVAKRILNHPKYIGTLVFNRTEQKLHTRSRPTPKGKWIMIPNAFEALVDPKLFAAAQERLASFPRHKSNEQLIDDIRRLLREKGRLSLPLMRQTRLRKSLGIASPKSYNIFQTSGFHQPDFPTRWLRTVNHKHFSSENRGTTHQTHADLTDLLYQVEC